MIIAPFAGSFSSALDRSAQAAGWRTLRACRSEPPTRTEAFASAEAGRGERGPAGAASTEAPRIDIPWNPASYVSAGALALAAGEAEVLVIVHEPDGADPSLFDAGPGGLGSALAAATEGPVYLAREFVRRFELAGKGRILLVSVEAPERAAGSAPGSSAFPALVAGAFRGLGEGLFDRARPGSFSAWGIQDRSGKPEAAAEFALRLLEEPKTSKSGRWLPYNGKAGIFGVF